MKYIVGKASELPTGSRTIVTVLGRSIGVFNVHGQYYALRNRCPHQGGPLCSGALLGRLSASEPGRFDFEAAQEVLTCPWHGWEFDIRTGQSWFDPVHTRVRRYDVELIGGADLAAESNGTCPPGPDLIKGPYLAETYPVSLCDDYVVLDVHG